MKILKLSVIGVFAMLIASCSTVSVNTDYDPGADFTSYKSFTIYSGETIPGDELAKHPLVKTRVETALKEQLQKKGLEYKESGDTDLIVVAHAGIKDRIQIQNWGSYHWYDPWWGPYGSTTTVSEYEESSLVIDFVDGAEKDLIWRGIGTAIVKDYSTPEKAQQAIDNYVSQILIKYPPSK